MKKNWPQGYRSAGFFVRYRRSFVLNNILLSDFQKKGFKMIHNLKIELYSLQKYHWCTLNAKQHVYIINLKYAHFTPAFSTQYPFRILYLLTKIQINIGYKKNSLKK